jgi:protein TonB
MDFVEEMPSFPGGQEAWNNYLDTAIKINSEVKGTVYVGFEVQANGEICNVVLKKGVPNAYFLNAEAMRVMKNSPNWNPGKMNGRAVCVHMNIPIKFD